MQEEYTSYNQRSAFQILPSASVTEVTDSEEEKDIWSQNYTCAEYIHSKFFFILVVADCLLLVRLVPALIAYCKTTAASIKFYFIFKLVTFFLYLSGSIVVMVLVGNKLRRDNVDETVQLQF